MTWQKNLIHDDEARIAELLAASRRIAVLGIKPEALAFKPAHYVPDYLQRAGYEIVPVPVYYPSTTTILGRPVYRELAAIPSAIDIVNVFRKPPDIPPHVADILAKRPRAVWFQLGIRNDEAAQQLAQAGILVVQDRCIMVDHRRLVR